MRRIIKLCFVAFVVLSLLFCLSDTAQAKGRGGYRSYKSSGYRSSGRSAYKSSSVGKSFKLKALRSTTPKLKRLTYTTKKSSKISIPSLKGSSITSKKSSKISTLTSSIGVKRDSKGRIERSSKAKKDFLNSKGYDKVPEGYEVDHIVPLYKGGADEPYNMQLLPKDVHKQKTKIDLKSE